MSLKHYDLFGLTMASNYAFKNRLIKGSDVPDIAFTCVNIPPFTLEWENKEPVFIRTGTKQDEEPIVSIYRFDSTLVVRYARILDFYLTSDQVIAHLRDISYKHIVEIRFLGEIISLWLEINDVPAIHASAVVVNNEAIGFLSTNKGGKSSLAAALMQKGYPLLTDDILAVEYNRGLFFGRPGYPTMRMWPDQAEFFLGKYHDLEIVHPWYTKRRIFVGSDGFGTFCNKKQPLKAIYIPQRSGSDSPIIIEPISKKDAFIELIRNSFNAEIVEALGLQAHRMDFFSRMVKQVPMRRLIYPEGFRHLAGITDVLIHDVATL